ncbi:MAG: DoxX family membrane protein [Parcubacteria group bacterium]|nr:DoxX family membrane protein [Parcubacteria group bacterium]
MIAVNNFFMKRYHTFFLFALRVTMGWMFFYAGITKILNPEWSAAGYLQSAKTFTGLYQWFASASLLPTVNFINEWGLTLLGLSLILGVFVRLSSLFGALLMLLYYFPILDFPYPNPNSFIVDQHIIFIFVLLYFAAIRAGRIYGLEERCARLPICSRFPKTRKWLG